MADRHLHNNFSTFLLVSKVRPNLKDLIQLEVATDWYNLGLQLDLEENKLNIIEQDNRQDSKTCQRKMFSRWLSSNKNASYQNLVKALIAINKMDIAEKVSQQFCKSQYC